MELVNRWDRFAGKHPGKRFRWMLFSFDISRIVPKTACKFLRVVQFRTENKSCFNFIGTKGADTLEVKMLFVDAKSFEHRIWKIFFFDPEIDHPCTDLAFKMAVGGGIRIVPDLISFDVKCQRHTGLNEQIQHIVNGCLRQSIDLVNEVAVDHIYGRMVSFRNQIAHEGSAFELNQHEVRRIIDLYKQVFEEFQII